jgi:hypothetical protein
MTGRSEVIGLFGDYQFTDLFPVNQLLPGNLRRTKKRPRVSRQGAFLCSLFQGPSGAGRTGTLEAYMKDGISGASI